MKEIIYKDIASYINKSEQTIKSYKKNNPELLSVLRVGAFCKKNDLDIEKIKKIIELKNVFKDKLQ